MLVAFLFSAVSTALTHAQTIQLGDAQPLPTSLYTFNTNLLTSIAFQGFRYDGPQLSDAVQTVRPFGLRFPGGTIANNYLWREDSFSEPTNDKTQWAAEQLRLFRKIGRPYDLPGYARLCKRKQQRPIWVLNVYEETSNSVVRLLERFRDLGLRVDVIELGNEPYWDGRSLNNVRQYIKYCRPLAAAIKKHDPSIQIGACFGPLDQPGNYEEKWNTPLAKENWYDAIIYHEYYGGQGFALEKGSEIPAKAMQHPEEMFDAPVREFAKLLPDKPIWFTEWNVGSAGLKQWNNKGAQLQFLAASFSRLMDHRQSIPLACYHDLYGPGYGVFQFDQEAGTSNGNAAAQFFQLLGAVMMGSTELRPTEFPGDHLVGFTTQAGTQMRMLVLNRGSEQTVSLPAEFTGSLIQTTIQCGPKRTLDARESLFETRQPKTNQVVLPSDSINVIANGPLALQLHESVRNSGNLFPHRPHLSLWYKPYARQQPRFDLEGIYSVDLNQLKDKKLAVVKMAISQLGLEAGAVYQIEFRAKSSQAGGISLRLPTEDPQNSQTFVLLQKNFQSTKLTFRYDPAINQNEVTFAIARKLIAQSGVVSFRDFELFKSDE